MGKFIWCIGFVIWAVLVTIIQVGYVSTKTAVPELMEYFTNILMFWLVMALVITYWRQILQVWWFVILWVLRLPGLFLMLVATVISALMMKYDRVLMKADAFVSPTKKGNHL